MKIPYTAVAMFVVGLLFNQDASSQILAITRDGQRVVLFTNGTWKFESEIDSTQVGDVVAKPQLPVTTITGMLPPPVPKPKPPRVYSLECSALVDVEKDIKTDANVAVSKSLSILKDDSTTAFTTSMMKSKKGSLMWTSIIPGKPCVGEDSKIIVVLKDGTRYTLTTDSKANCDGVFKIFFGNLDGKDIPLQSMKDQEILSVKIFLQKGFVEANFGEESAKKFKAAINCIAKNL